MSQFTPGIAESALLETQYPFIAECSEATNLDDGSPILS